MQEAVSLHPAVRDGGGAAFVLGAILAVPATVVATILLEELWFERLEGGNERADEEKEGEAS